VPNANAPVIYLPAYVPPNSALPESTNPALAFDPPPLPKRYRRRSGVGKYAGVVFSLLLLGALVAGVYFAVPYVKQYRDQYLANAEPREPNPSQVEPTPTLAAKASGPFPRRMLVMNASKYLYCNGLTAGKGEHSPDRVNEAARRLAFDWRVSREADNNQLYVLSDTAPKDARPMLRPIVMETYKRFCETSRPQDRVLLYFGGHAVAKDGKAYLVPTDGDLDDPATLIPLDDLWTKLKDCKAQQKVVVFDVCRLNEDGDTVRPGSEPMTPELEKALLAAPPGVQVVTTCAAGQNALEYRRPPRDFADVTGSLFLSALGHVADKGAANTGKPPAPDDPLPVVRWVEAARAWMKTVATATGKPVPTPKIAGSEPGAAVALNPDEPPAARVEFPAPPKGVAPDEVVGIAGRIALPPLRTNRSTTEKEESLAKLVPFAETAMKGYMPDGVSDEEIQADPEKYPIRKAALDTLAALRKSWDKLQNPKTGEPGIRDRFVEETTEAVKKRIVAEQEAPALIGLEMKTRVQVMEPLLDQLDKEQSKYWQATFLYALAQAKARLAFIEEYNYALGNIRTDSLPQRDEKKGQVGLQLVSVEKMKSKKEIREIADSAKELFARIAKEHKGTPWAVQAKRDEAVALGLEWRPFTGDGQ
jgi:hypothetical protein